MNLIITTPEELRAIIADEVDKAVARAMREAHAKMSGAGQQQQENTQQVLHSAAPNMQEKHVLRATPTSRVDTAGIAALLGCSRAHVTNRLTKRTDFPQPFINVSRQMRYWRVADVLAWGRGKRHR